jgi:hypothetical protein
MAQETILNDLVIYFFKPYLEQGKFDGTYGGWILM